MLGIVFRRRLAHARCETLKYSLLVGLIFTLEPVFSAVFAFFLLGDPRLSRVVGYVLHANPEPGVIPCHRVVGTNGSPTGYGGGSARKVKLLELEHADMHRFFVPKKGTAL